MKNLSKKCSFLRSKPELMSGFGCYLASAPVHLAALVRENDMPPPERGDLIELDRDEGMTAHGEKQTALRSGWCPYLLRYYKSCLLPSEVTKKIPSLGGDEAGLMNKRKISIQHAAYLGPYRR